MFYQKLYYSLHIPHVIDKVGNGTTSDYLLIACHVVLIQNIQVHIDVDASSSFFGKIDRNADIVKQIVTNIATVLLSTIAQIISFRKVVAKRQVALHFMFSLQKFDIQTI